MATIEDAKEKPLATLTRANYLLERLDHFIRKHATCVGGRNRKELQELSTLVMRRHAEIATVIAGGTSAVEDLNVLQLADILEDIASAGLSALQVLGGFLARNEEPWGGPFEEDEGKKSGWDDLS